MGGFGREARTSSYRRGLTGPKLEYLRQMTKAETTDILVLSEIRIKTAEECRKVRIAGLQPTIMTTTGRAAGGVMVLTCKDISYIQNSSIESDPPGHYVLGVFEVCGSKCIIGGVYLDASGVDNIGETALHNMSRDITILSARHNAFTTIISGDFNVTIVASECSGQRITKEHTAQKFMDLLEEYNLRDVGTYKGNTMATYRRHADSSVFSRIDYTLCSDTLEIKEYKLQWGPLDHACLHTSIIMPERARPRLPATRDWIIGSEDYMLKARDIIIKTLLDHDANQTYVSARELHDMVHAGIPEAWEQTLDLSNADEGINDLHVLNVLIKKLQTLAGKLGRQHKRKTENMLTNADSRLKALHTSITNEANADRKRELEMQVTEHKIHCRDKLVQIATRNQARIDTFHSNNKGRMTRCSFTNLQARRAHKNISKLNINGREVTDQDEIVQIMRDKYMDCTGGHHVMDMTVEQFLRDHDIQLPTISNEQASELEKEITKDDIKTALQAAKVSSAPGPTGQTLGFYKFIFHQIPHIFTRCINMIAFYTDILDSSSLKWIKERKIIYIPKPGKDPLLPSSYRPLSMLEILYKIPSKILTDRLGAILPDLSYSDQAGFVPGRGAQYGTLAAMHVVQDAEKHGKGAQLLGIDISGAFDAIQASCIRECMVLNGIPGTYIEAVHNLTKEGRAQVEVNGQLGERFIQHSGVGQGDPLSAFRFNIGTEPLLRALQKHTRHIAYTDTAGTAIYPGAYADDHLHHLAARTAEDIQSILHVYREYSRVSGLHINVAKTEL